MKPSVRVIAERVHIDTGWSEIHPDPPLEVSKQVQRVSIEVPDVADWDVRPNDATFVRPDGTPIRIEVELIAADGTRFELASLGLGPGLTFSFLPPDTDASRSRLPPDMKFTALRMRSDAPFDGGRVSWICITNY